MTDHEDHPQSLSEDQIADRLKAIARGWSHPLRSPVLRTPADEGLDYEDVTFPSQDGVPLEAWFIPRAGSDRLVIVNHPLMFNRYGCPTHLEPWRSFGATSGNTFEVDYVADYRVLHEAGYNVLTYDERNFGLSGDANGGLNSGGRYQGRDVIGSLLYARSREDLRDMAVGLFSRCNGANANLYAIHTQPQVFDGVRCMLLCQPLSIRSVMTRELEGLGLGDRIGQLDREIQRVASLTFDQMSPPLWARSVKIPTFVYQVHDDVLTTPADVQATFDAIPIPQKKLHWIDSDPAFERSATKIHCSGDVAFSTGLTRFTGSIGGKAFDLWTRETLGYRKFEGRWRIIHDHVSVPIDLETGIGVTDCRP